MKAILKKEDRYDQNIKILQELATITVKPIEIIEFTNEYEPILFPGADMGQGISNVIKTASDTGIRVLETGTTLVKDVVSRSQCHKRTHKNNYYYSKHCRKNYITPHRI